MTNAGSDALLEREGELVVIDRFVGTDTTRSGGMLLIRGPAGIGKTRLLDAVAARGAERGLAVHSARAGELEGDLAWGVVRQLFSPVLTGFRAGDDPVLSGAARLARPALGLGDEPVGADSLSAARCCWRSTTSSGPTRLPHAGCSTSPSASPTSRSCSP